MDRLAYTLLPLAGGVLVAAQAPINARLRTVLGSPLAAGFVSFAVGTALLLVLTVLAGQAGAVSRVGGGPWWAYLGGVCGTALVVGTLVAAPRIGVLATFVAVIVGQVAMALAIDRFGWFHAHRIPVTLDRLLGIGFVVAGLLLILRRR